MRQEMENVLTAVMTMRPSYLPLSVAEMKLILRAPPKNHPTVLSKPNSAVTGRS
jgi:hypothetical protein